MSAHVRTRPPGAAQQWGLGTLLQTSAGAFYPAYGSSALFLAEKALDFTSETGVPRPARVEGCLCALKLTGLIFPLLSICMWTES